MGGTECGHPGVVGEAWVCGKAPDPQLAPKEKAYLICLEGSDLMATRQVTCLGRFHNCCLQVGWQKRTFQDVARSQPPKSQFLVQLEDATYFLSSTPTDR